MPVVAAKNGSDFLHCVLRLCGGAIVHCYLRNTFALGEEIPVCVNSSPHLAVRLNFEESEIHPASDERG